MDDDAFVIGATTSAEDLADQLRLLAAKLAAPGWDPKPVLRAKAALEAGYPALGASPDGVLARDLDRLLHAGDPRWGTPSGSARTCSRCPGATAKSGCSR